MHNSKHFLPVYNGTSDTKWEKTPNLIRGATDPVHVVTGAAGNVEGQESLELAPPRAGLSVYIRTPPNLTMVVSFLAGAAGDV